MNPRQIKLGLWSVSGVLTCAAAAAMLWAARAPLNIAPSPPHADRGASPTSTAVVETPPSLPPLETFAVIWRSPVRAPLSQGSAATEAPSPPRPQTPPPPPLTLTLLATAVERDRAYAVLLSERREIEVRQVGESTGSAKITRIEDNRVEVEHHGRTVTLSIPHAHGSAPPLSLGPAVPPGKPTP